MLSVTMLRAVLAAGLVGSLLVQGAMTPLLAADLDDAPAGVRWPVVAIVLLGILTVQVGMVCVWRLLTLVRRGTVFSDAAFRYVDLIVAAAASAALLLFALGAVLAPGEAVAPGVVLLVGGAGGLVLGVALLVVVMRALLAQAVARELEATALRAELDEVI
jgi:hypothetical protein